MLMLLVAITRPSLWSMLQKKLWRGWSVTSTPLLRCAYFEREVLDIANQDGVI